jgi:hypothetical protein
MAFSGRASDIVTGRDLAWAATLDNVARVGVQRTALKNLHLAAVIAASAAFLAGCDRQRDCYDAAGNPVACQRSSARYGGYFAGGKFTRGRGGGGDVDTTVSRGGFGGEGASHGGFWGRSGG